MKNGSNYEEAMCLLKQRKVLQKPKGKRYGLIISPDS